MMRQQNEQINNPKELIIQKLATANPLRSYTTRIAKMEDKEQLMALINSAYEDSNWFKQPHFHNRVNDQTITKYIQDEPNFFIIVQDKDIIVGCIYIKLPTEEKECAGFGLLSVHSKYQRQGISKYLISQTESFLQHNSQSIKKIRIEVVNLQTHLLEIYKKMGFEVVGKCEWEDMGLSKSDVCVDSFFYILEKSIYIQQQ